MGDTDCHQLVGISYWTGPDGPRLAKDVANDFNMPGGKEKTWGSVSLTTHIKEYKTALRECTFDDITEIDTFNELKAIDPAYGQVQKILLFG